MNRKALLPQDEDVAVKLARAMMDHTMVSIPFGPPRSFDTLDYGGNVFICLYFFLASLFCLHSVLRGES